MPGGADPRLVGTIGRVLLLSLFACANFGPTSMLQLLLLLLYVEPKRVKTQMVGGVLSHLLHGAGLKKLIVHAALTPVQCVDEGESVLRLCIMYPPVVSTVGQSYG